ncbi:hypothetical protein EIN_369640 [Entamoeba invadens IP1]|uniref:PRA1 family protein n=1 Tax=Entamoeba invadens IP1 TaxID=370355 RepID=A0A0A1UGG4_ENTIV|nr:hypothetical protein EIN_369640 [Entamoeba invadens IP1]ELP92642.1 hypothetical protein EIN_369640 [Entamoeba invadens IP1]|eukprot:XP_004259413.1 hypothetical protein EIN_369640 [Entamoeba invadens IP1]
MIDLGKLVEVNVRMFQEDITSLFSKRFKTPKNVNKFIERANINMNENKISFTSIGIVFALLFSALLEPKNIWSIVFFVLVIVAHLVIKEVNDEINTKIWLNGLFIFLYCATFYFLVATISGIVPFAFVCLVVAFVVDYLLAGFLAQKKEKSNNKKDKKDKKNKEKTELSVF